MKNIGASVEGLKKEAGGQMDKLLAEATNFQFRIHMLEENIKGVKDELRRFRVQVDSIGTSVELYDIMLKRIDGNCNGPYPGYIFPPVSSI